MSHDSHSTVTGRQVAELLQSLSSTLKPGKASTVSYVDAMTTIDAAVRKARTILGGGQPGGRPWND